jgi:hypothetical protein
MEQVDGERQEGILPLSKLLQFTPEMDEQVHLIRGYMRSTSPEIRDSASAAIRLALAEFSNHLNTVSDQRLTEWTRAYQISVAVSDKTTDRAITVDTSFAEQIQKVYEWLVSRGVKGANAKSGANQRLIVILALKWMTEWITQNHPRLQRYTGK